MAVFRCEPIPEEAGDFYAAVKLARQQRGLTLDENDLWIAATALALGATLVTRDGDFGAIDGLRVVESGLAPTDKVIVHGVQKVFMPGMPVAPKTIVMGAPPVGEQVAQK